MTRSLREMHETKRVEQLRERVKKIDDHVMVEHRMAQLLVEAMSEEDLNKVTAIVQKLSSIKNPQLPRLTAAIEQAEAEINKYTAGGPISKAWTKMKDLVGIDNPIVKVTTFANALEKGFSQVPTILKNNGIDLKNVDLSKSLATVLSTPATGTATKTGAKADSDLANTSYSSMGSSQNEAEGQKVNVEGKLKLIVDQLRKALSPGGIFGVFKKVPYINADELAQELVQVPLNVFSQVAKKVQSGAKAAEIAPDLKSQVTGQGNAETKGTVSGAETTATGQSIPGTPTKDPTVTTNTTATGQQTPRPQGGGAAQNYSVAKQKLIPLFKGLKGKNDGMDQLAKRLVDAGLDPNKL